MAETGACHQVLIATKCQRISVAVSLPTAVTVIKSKIMTKQIIIIIIIIINKYQDLAHGIQQEWYLNKVTVIPLVLSARVSYRTCLTRASLPSVYWHAYGPRSNKWSY
jgi:hypothetical protein